MSDWKEGYIRAVTKYIIKNGDQHDFSRGGVYSSGKKYFNKGDDPRKDILEHLEECGFSKVKVDDIQWSEFEGTFTDNSEHHGIGVNIGCPCGKYSLAEGIGKYNYVSNSDRENDIVYRVSGNFSDLLLGVFQEDD